MNTIDTNKLRVHKKKNDVLKELRDWLEEKPETRCYYIIDLISKRIWHQENFRIFGFSKINYHRIRSASPCPFYNEFEHQLSREALLMSKHNPGIANCNFSILRLVNDFKNATYIIHRDSNFVVIYSKNSFGAGNLIVKIERRQPVPNNILFPFWGEFSRSKGKVLIEASLELNKQAFLKTINKIFTPKQFSILEGKFLGLDDELCRVYAEIPTMATYEKHLGDIKVRLKQNLNNSTINIGYFISVCGIYFRDIN